MQFTQHPTRKSGFTLIELMVVCAIIGIIAAVAYPSYTRYVVKGNRAATQAHLIDLAQRQQQFFADSRTYADTVAELNMTTPTEVSRHYTLSIVTSDGPPPSFTITATPIATGAQASDGALSIDSNGAKTPNDKW